LRIHNLALQLATNILSKTIHFIYEISIVVIEFLAINEVLLVKNIERLDQIFNLQQQRISVAISRNSASKLFRAPNEEGHQEIISKTIQKGLS
jgi:hypothetical protein